MDRDELRKAFAEKGEESVRQHAKLWTGDVQRFADEWLNERHKEAEIRLQASEAKNESAQALAAVAASRAATAAERQADAAEKANTRATIALIIASASIIANVIMACWMANRPPSPFASVSRSVSAASSPAASNVHPPQRGLARLIHGWGDIGLAGVA
jgi:hypothetical protein